MVKARLAAVLVGGLPLLLAGTGNCAPSSDAGPNASRAAAGIQIAAKKMPPRPIPEAEPPPPPPLPEDTQVDNPAAQSVTADFVAPKRTLADCMQTWDKDTHMTKAEWKATCIRSLNEADKHERAVKAEQTRRPRKKTTR